MRVPRLLLLCIAGLLIAAATPATATVADGIADVNVDNLVIGESHQPIGPIRLAGFPDDAENLTLRLNLSVLEQHGIGIENASVDLTDDRVRGGTLATATVRDGVVVIVIEPTDTGVLLAPFELSGLATAGAEPGTDLEYETQFSAGDARVDTFDLIDPAAVTPRVEPRALILGEGAHEVHIEALRPAGVNVTVTLDVSELRSYGVGLSELEATVSADGATVVETRVVDGTVTVVASPDAEATLFDIEVTLSGFEATDVATGTPLLATDVRYEVSIDGDGADGASVIGVDVYRRMPSPHRDEEIVTDEDPRGGVEVPGGQPGLGPVVAVLALLAVATLAIRRSDAP